ncbi:MAG: hypothetical protein AB7O52_00750 [Planctomycetota bacterium]
MTESDGRAGQGAAEPTKEELKRAVQAFRKRLKLFQLDDESRIGHSAMSSGGKSGIVGIRLPDGFAPAVWEKLVAQGKLKYMGNGLYGRGDTGS